MIFPREKRYVITLSIRPSVRPSIRSSVRPSVCPFVRMCDNFLVNHKTHRTNIFSVSLCYSTLSYAGGIRICFVSGNAKKMENKKTYFAIFSLDVFLFNNWNTVFLVNSVSLPTSERDTLTCTGNN